MSALPARKIPDRHSSTTDWSSCSENSNSMVLLSTPAMPGACSVCARADRIDGLTMVSKNTPLGLRVVVRINRSSTLRLSAYVSEFRSPSM